MELFAIENLSIQTHKLRCIPAPKLNFFFPLLLVYFNTRLVPTFRYLPFVEIESSESVVPGGVLSLDNNVLLSDLTR